MEDMEGSTQEKQKFQQGVKSRLTTRIAIIGLVLAVVNLTYTIISIQSVGGWSAYTEMIQEAIEQAQQAQ